MLVVVTKMMAVVMTTMMVGGEQDGVRMKRMARQRGEIYISGYSYVDHRSETMGKVDQGKWK